MGLGKTIQSITFLSEIFLRGIHGPFLIIAPLSTITNWEREFRTWTEMNAIVYHGSQISRQMIQQYEMVYRDAQVSPPPVAGIQDSLPSWCTTASLPLVFQSSVPCMELLLTYSVESRSYWGRHLTPPCNFIVIKHRTVGHTCHSNMHQRLFLGPRKFLGWLRKLLLHAENFIWIVMCSVKKVSRGICEQRKDPQPTSLEREEVNGFEVKG